MNDAAHPTATGSKRILGLILIVVCSALFVGGIFYFNYSAFDGFFGRIDPNSSGTTVVKAKITDRYSTSGPRSGGAVISYAYNVNGQSYSKKEDVDQIAYQLTLNSDSIEIVYLTAQPEKSNVVISEDGTLGLIKIIIVDVIILICIVVVYRRAKKAEQAAKT